MTTPRKPTTPAAKPATARKPAAKAATVKLSFGTVPAPDYSAYGSKPLTQAASDYVTWLEAVLGEKFSPAERRTAAISAMGMRQKYQECVRGANPHARGNRNAG